MKVKLTFDFNDEDDVISHLRATKSLDMCLAIWEIIHNTKKSLVNKIELALNEDKNLDPYDAVELVFDRIYEIMDEHDIRIDKLIN